MKTYKQAAGRMRRSMNAAGAVLTDEQALQAVEIYPVWDAAAAYETGKRVRCGGQLYRCLQTHAAQEAWAPGAAPSLWVRIDDPAQVWPAWRQPGGTEDAYALGAKVTHSERRWISEVDGNVWEPGVAMWSEAM